MKTSISPPRTTPLLWRAPHRPAAARLPLPSSSGPCCSLKARPLPHPEPAPSWDDLLGQR